MKNLILVIAAICFAAIVSAQSSTPAATNGVKPVAAQNAPASATTPATATAKATPVTWYGCPKCDFTSQKEGKCPTHQTALLKDHSYFCADGLSSEKPGKCKDGKDMGMMDCKAKMMSARAKMKDAKPAPAPAPTPAK